MTTRPAGTTQPQGPSNRGRQPLASVGLSGAEEFDRCFLRGASLESC